MRRTLQLAIMTALGLGGCGSKAPLTSDAAPPSSCVSVSQLKAWQQEIDQFDGGYRPSGSPAHESYIAQLASELTGLGVSDVHTEPFSFTKWTPSTWSLKLVNGSAVGPIALSGYVPYSGSTGPSGVTAGMVYVPATAIPLDAAALVQALADPNTWEQTLITQLQVTFALLDVHGKIAVFDVPKLVVALNTLTGRQLLINDPDGTMPPNAIVSRTDLAAILIVPAMLNALAAAGAVGAVGILPLPEQAARGEYAPFFGITTLNLPSVYVDRAHGEVLKHAIAGNLLQTSALILDASVAMATSENVIGVLPGASDEEILLGSHTDGPNSMEDNGPVAILALASCLASEQRPRTLRIVLSGGHFVASAGLMSYASMHASDLSTHALAVMELEHLGALEWSELSPGVMGLTGLPELQLLTTSLDQPLVDASEAYANQFTRSIVATPPLLGEGHNFGSVPLVQFLSMPQYLLVGHLPAITTDFTDYDLMLRQVLAFRDMEISLANAPANQLGH